MAKAQKTVSIRLEVDDYNFLRNLAEADKEDLSTEIRDLVGRGRVLLALERYREGKASLSKAAEVAGLSIGEMLDVLAEHGVRSRRRGLPRKHRDVARGLVDRARPLGIRADTPAGLRIDPCCEFGSTDAAIGSSRPDIGSYTADLGRSGND
jgi:predicted HTH domain antitoxin